jgi:glycosyltransferase involved in cell wall biosynthesis
MRQGQNPAKFVRNVAKPENVTVAVLIYIPFLSGYYEQSLDVLKLCLWSIWEHTDGPFDLMVFDNGSCQEVVEYLETSFELGLVQYLQLSSRNLGKVGAWNMILSGAPGEWIVFADSDIFFFPGWLPAHLELFNHYPGVGTVTGLPRRRRITFSERTLERVAEHPEIEISQGHFIPEEWIVDHARSVGKMEALDSELARDDFLLEYRGMQAYVTAQHFQFMVRKEVLEPYLPFDYTRPMGKDVANFDRAIESSGLLRIATKERTIMHMGNRVDPELIRSLQLGGTEVTENMLLIPTRTSTRRRILDWAPVRYTLLGIYNRIFRWFFTT